MSSTIAGPGYLVRRASAAPTIPCPCGESTRILTREDGPLVNFHITRIVDSAKHYHKNCTELYYILEGTGTLELNDDAVEIEPGMLIQIDPYTRHRLSSPQGARVIVIGVPAWDPSDEYLVEG